MKKEISITFILASIFFLLGESVFAQSATLISNEIELCLDESYYDESLDIPKSISIDYEIDFEGESYFNAWLYLENISDENNPEFMMESREVTNWTMQGSENYVGSFGFTPSHYPNVTKLRITISKFISNNSGELHTAIGEIIVHILRKPTPSISNDFISTCGYSTEIVVTPGNGSNVFEWESPINPEQVTFSNLGQPVTTFSALERGTYNINFSETIGIGCTATIPIQVELLGRPKGEISTDTEICGNGEATINFSMNGNTKFYVKYTDGTSSFDETISALQENRTHNVVGRTEFHIVSIKDDNGCDAIAEDMTGSAVVIDLTPFANAGEYDGECSYEIETSANALETGMTGRWSSLDGFFDDDTLPNTTFFAYEYGTSTLTWTVTNKGCSGSDEVKITFWEAPLQSDANAGSDTLLYYTSKTTLNASKPRIGTGLWSTNDNEVIIANPTDSITNVSGLKYGETKFIWTITNGVCPSVYDDVIITIKGLRCPTGFSPNGDGINDTFVIEGAEQIRNNQLIVFDKDGFVVFKQSDYKEGVFWDGTKNGSPVPDGIYHYVFSGEDVDSVKNFLVIKRTKN